jgi:hypothetical protein
MRRNCCTVQKLHGGIATPIRIRDRRFHFFCGVFLIDIYELVINATLTIIIVITARRDWPDVIFNFSESGEILSRRLGEILQFLLFSVGGSCSRRTRCTYFYTFLHWSSTRFIFIINILQTFNSP